MNAKDKLFPPATSVPAGTSGALATLATLDEVVERMAEQVARLEARLSLIEATPTTQREARMLALARENTKQQRAAAEHERQERARTAPRRQELFEAFVTQWIERGPGRRVQHGHVHAAFVRWCDENEVPLEVRMTNTELFEALESLEGVEIGPMRSHLGGKITGFIGVTIVDEHAPDTHVSQDMATIRRAQFDEAMASA